MKFQNKKIVFFLGLIVVTGYCNAVNGQSVSLTNKNAQIVPTKVNCSLAQEISGILALGNQRSSIIGIQDGGNKPEILLFRPGNSTQRMGLPIKNRDWEAITANQEYLYIGDFGNNRGNRRDLCVYRIKRNNTESLFNAIDSVGVNGDSVADFQIDSIAFAFEDQRQFKPRFRHNFDCESMLVREDSIWLFTKNWSNFRCNIYLIPALPGDYVARKIGSVNTRFLVTDACWLENKVAMVGYTIWGNQYFNQLDLRSMKLHRRVRIPLKPAQVEGVAYRLSTQELFIATEARKTQQSAIYRLKFR